MTTKPKKDTVDPRVRMKEIRSEVAMYVGPKKSNPGGLSHLGELPKNMADARRVIIALQDLLEKSTERHKKASNRIRDFLQMKAGLLAQIAGAHNAAKIYQERLVIAENRYEELREKAKLQSESVVALANETHFLEEQLVAMTEERDTWRATASLVIKEDR